MMPRANFLQTMLNNCPGLQARNDSIINFWKAHKTETTFDLPVPPFMIYEHCWACDTAKQNKYDKDVDMYDSAVFVEEYRWITEAIGMRRDLALMGLESGTRLDPANVLYTQTIIEMLGSYQHPTTCTWMRDADENLSEAVDFLVNRYYYKAQALFYKYKKDEHYLQGIIKIYLKASRQRMLTISESNYSKDPTLADVGEAEYDFFVKYRERIFIKHDWTQLPNIKFLFSLARETALLGHEDQLVNNFLKDFIKYDRFKLSMDVAVKEGTQGAYQLARLTGDNYISAVPDDSLCMRWVLVESSDPKKYLNLKLEAAEFMLPKDKPIYAGTHVWKTTTPDIRFHLCDDSKDTIIIHTIFPEGLVEKWNIPYSASKNPSQPFVQNLLNAGFLDIKNVKLSASEAKSNEDKMKKEIEELGVKMKAMAEEMEKQMKAGKRPIAEQMAKISKMQNMGNEMQQSFTKYVPHAIGNYFFEVPIQNGNNVMIHAIIDGKKLFPENTELVYAIFKIDVKQELKEEPKK